MKTAMWQDLYWDINQNNRYDGVHEEIWPWVVLAFIGLGYYLWVERRNIWLNLAFLQGLSYAVEWVVIMICLVWGYYLPLAMVAVIYGGSYWLRNDHPLACKIVTYQDKSVNFLVSVVAEACVRSLILILAQGLQQMFKGCCKRR